MLRPDTNGKTSRLSRSPHPYHRRGSSLLQQDPPSNDSSITPLEHAHGRTPARRRLAITSSSESGTEADDERGRILKSLPAPLLRTHKGLRDASGLAVTPLPSPVCTPAVGDEPTSGFPWQVIGFGVKTGVKAAEQGGDEAKAVREKYTKRKRKELVRRITETVLFFAVGGLVGHKSLWHTTTQRAVVRQLAIVAALYTWFPFGATVRAKSAGHRLTVALRRSLHVPSRFDPAPLLYPVFLPVVVVLSLTSRSSEMNLANIILGLASLPPQVVPVKAAFSDLNCFHWLLSIIPAVGSITYRQGEMEVLTLLFPLFVFTLHTIEFLTTTSLDISELRLLTTALINMYLFAMSAQSHILKALLWLGTVMMFILCKQPLQWEVALARIPGWRFRRPTSRAKPRGLVSRLLDRAILAILGHRIQLQLSWKGSESSGEDESLSSTQSWRERQGFAVGDNQLRKQKTADSLDPHFIIANGEDRPPHIKENEKHVNGHFAPQRRHTLASTEWEEVLVQPRSTPSGRRKRVREGPSQLFVSLTRTQAAIRKWAYAILVYFFTVLIILGPIRKYVSVFSLQSHEPFGWALGYLLGDLPLFRDWVVSTGLDVWIPLPLEQSSVNPQHGWVEHYQHHVIGLANTRLLICAYCILILLIGISIVLWLSSQVEVDTRRKVFHGTIVAILLPTIYIDPCFTSLALGLILAIFLLLDLFRACQLPPISRPLTLFLAPYVDGRDYRGPVIVSHIFLLIGCAIPLWLSLADLPRSGEEPWVGWSTQSRNVSMVSGVICVGMGDSAASLIGRRYGRHKWYWAGGKSLEGSLAFAGAVTVGLLMASTWLRVGGWTARGENEMGFFVVLGKASMAATGASLTEAVLTGANDNVVVPVVLWLLVRGFGL